jgi:2-phospho-L-lactate/phosphoenolpyruvate guanylyltransferase
MIWGILPIKDLDAAKTRLSGVLSAAERQDLFRAMLTDVLAAVAEVKLDGVLMITGDAEAAAMARDRGLRILAEDDNQGQTAAVEAAVQFIADEGAETIMTIPGDVPLATAAEFETVLAGHPAAPAMSIVPAHDRRGSNCIVCSPPTAVPLRFGNDSFQPHLARAQSLDIDPRIVPLPGIGLDVDTPADLAELIARPGNTLSQAYLIDSGIADRMRVPA